MTFKQQILSRYKELLQDRIDIFQDMITGLTIDAQNDAKGSAGDKHETALSMMHLEQEKLNHKLKEILEQKSILDKIDASQIHKKIALGSLVQANGMLLFISAALPKITIDNKTIFALSPQSPLGSKLMGNQIDFSFDMNGKLYTIESVL
jgi:transcription elongation GreA/GreB family factor